MSIYRGEGGSGDATNDATISDATAQAVIASTKAGEAAASATAAAASATSVQTLTAATGAAGSSASYNAGTNTLTVPRGNTGAAGSTGAKGDTGAQGAQGNTGAAGADGADGADGDDGADGTGATTSSVTAAGALMDSEVTNLAQVKAFAASDYATAAQGTLAAAALPKSGGAMTGAITTNSTFDGRDVATDGTKLDGIEASATADQTNAEIRAAVEAASDSNVFTDADHTKLNAIEASADVTDATNVTAAGALMDSELTNLAAVKAINQSLVTTATPTFAEITSAGDVNLTAGASDWAFTVTSNNLIISYGGTSKAKLDTSGNLIVIGNVTAYGSI